MSVEYETVTAFRCPDCGEIARDEGGPVYECSRCNATKVDDEGPPVRCETCNIFMAKIGGQSCVECEQPTELEEITAFEHGGELYETVKAIERYIADAPKRAKQQAETNRFMDNFQQEREQMLARREEGIPSIIEQLGPYSTELMDRLHITWSDGKVQRRSARDLGETITLPIEDVIAIAEAMRQLKGQS